MLSQDELSEMQEYVQRLATKILMLEDDSTKVFASIIDRDDNINADKSFFFRNAKIIRHDLLEMQQSIDDCQANLTKLALLFHGTLKKEKFSKFSDALDNVPFEFFLTTDESKKLE